MTMHCPICEVGWDDLHVNTCWNCGTPGVRGFMRLTTSTTDAQRATTDQLLRTA